MSDRGMTRRELIKRSLQAGAYAAPLILAAGVPAAVAAASPVLVTFMQDALLADAGPLATFDVTYTLSTQPSSPPISAGSFTTDRFGFGGITPPFSITVDRNTITSGSFVTLTFTLRGASAPAVVRSFALIASLASPATSFLGLVVQEPTVAACQIGPLSQFNEYIDVAIINGPASTAYNFFVQPAGVATPVLVTTASTNANGNLTVFAPGLVSLAAPGAPTSVTVTAVKVGTTSPAFSLTASGAALTTISCTSLSSAGSAHALGIAPK
jgi:hypothetical protein